MKRIHQCDICGDFGAKRCTPCGERLRANINAHYREELTPAGPQLVLQGPEARDRPRTAQLSLWP